jgi:hypothetical protein
LNKSRFGPTVGILLLGLLLLLFQDHLGGWSKTEQITKLNASIIPAANFLKTQRARAEIAENQIPGSEIMLPAVTKARSGPDQFGSWRHSAEAGGDWIDIAYSFQS